MKILLLEDDLQTAAFIRKGLEQAGFTVAHSSDGKSGLVMAQEEEFDLGIFDVMLPRLDGFSVVRKLRETKPTVPVIILSARDAVEDRVKGLQCGSDDYVTKPFNMMVLVLRIRKLIEQSRYRHATHAVIDPTPSDIVITSLDEKLIEKAIKYVEDNISRSNFSVEELSRGLGMSRVHLYKKLLQITGKTPIEFIRVIRLKRAGRYFKEEFGMLPSEYQEKGGINKSF